MKLAKLFTLTKAIRSFFEEKNFIYIDAPPLVENPGMEVHIHPFSVASVKDKSPHGYLHTSPEFFMKKVLADFDENFQNIFTISFSYRDEPNSPHHRKQFLMLEWYRKNVRYEQILSDVKDLIQHTYTSFHKPVPHIQEVTVNELFLKYLGMSILDYLETDKLYQYIQKSFADIPLSGHKNQWAWDDLFFLLFLNKIEPELTGLGAIIIKEYPAPLAALSTISESDPRVCERFELYIDGLEIANCFNEVTDKETLVRRFEAQNIDKKNLYGYELNEPTEFYQTMENYPKSSGIALGVERLLQTIEKIDDPFISF